MSLESIQQNYSDATGFVIDRTVSPPKILGQAFLVSKSRAVTCASSVFNYVEAPWALGLQFIHPDVTDSIKGITLHNDFDKVAARKWYLAQTGNPGDQLVLPNDMASLTLDFNQPNVEPDKIAELNRALSLPFSSEGVEASGNIRGIEFLSILQNVLQSGKEGLLTFMDSRNLPIGRIQVGGGNILKVYFRGLLGELAFFEMLYRKPAEGYSFQTTVPFNWGNVRDITAPAGALIEEAQRRVGELPSMLNYLGGNDARYQKRVETVDPAQVSENIQWLMERLWASIDGYMTLDKMSERVGADTYTVVQAMRECVNRAFVSMINRSTPFHCSQQVGTPLVSHTDFEVNAWDPLQAFYLDPLSGKPTWMQGNFFGVANALQPKNMLHTIAMPNNVPGALILKDYKLIGVHSGPHVPKPGTPLPPVKLYQMMWMGALLEMSTKRSKLDDSATGEQGSAISGLRGKLDIEEAAAAAASAQDKEKLEKFVCPNCYSTNTKVGPCFNCGTVIEPPPPEPEAEGTKAKAVSEISKLQKKYNVTNQQLALVAAVVIGVPVFGFAFCGGGGTPPPAVTDTTTTTERVHKSSDKAVALATKYGGLQGTAVGGYWYEDTSDLTKPAQSFGLNSELSNQKVLFVIMDDMAPVQNLENFVGLPPFVDGIQRTKAEAAKVDEGNVLFGSDNLQWFVGKYERPPKEPQEVLTAAYASPEKGKSVLVVGQAFDSTKGYDPKITLGLLDSMAGEFTANGNSKRNGDKKPIVKKADPGSTDETPVEEKPLATEKEVDEFVEGLATVIQPKLKTPDDIEELLKKKKPPKIKSSLAVVINEDGSVKKLEILEPGDFESATNALTRAVNAAVPYEGVPHTKDGQVAIVVKLDANKIKVERP
ncbi:MAG: DUF4388 domain-containing protein [Candidatus Melainabacteria bacterium]|nr:DUF4388 domain-containing protein [Candidatus Melainabacteria bacterium]